MFAFRRFERSTTLFIGLLLLSFLVATFDVRADGTGVGEALREGTQALFTPLQKLADAVARPVVGVIDSLSDLAGLRDENERLRAEVDRLTREAEETASLNAYVTQLEDALGIQEPEELNAIPARIFSASPSDFDNIRNIDRGSADGVVVGQAVIDDRGLVGRIVLVGHGWAKVRLISDPVVGVGVRVLETNETGWVWGQGDGLLRLEMFSATKPVRESYFVVTDGTRFPPNILVGTVTDTADSEGGVLRTEVELAISVSQLDFVKVIIDWSPLDTRLPDDADLSPLPPPVTEDIPTP